MNKLQEVLAKIEPLDEAAMAAAQAHLDKLTKPLGTVPDNHFSAP